MKESQEAFLLMVNVFGATDGGAALVTFRNNYDILQERAKNGDEDAQALVDVFEQSARLVKHISGIKQ